MEGIQAGDADFDNNDDDEDDDKDDDTGSHNTENVASHQDTDVDMDYVEEYKKNEDDSGNRWTRQYFHSIQLITSFFGHPS